MNLETKIKLTSQDTATFKPAIFNLSKLQDRRQLKKLFGQKKIQRVVDDYPEQLKEFFAIKNPSLIYKNDFNRFVSNFLKAQGQIIKQGRWIFYSWQNSLVHVLSPTAFFKVRTARNHNLITPNEQQKFYDAAVGIAGLSVGNSAALAIVLQGGAKHIKLADFDTLALSNINRIRSSVVALGLKKTVMTARQIYELNPYAKVEIFSEGLNEKNINRFCTGLDVLVDEVDDLSVKYLLREKAKKRRLPIVMAADNGDNAVVDVERYDFKTPVKFFHGRLGKIGYQQLKKLDKFGIGQLITRHIGPENVTERMQDSLQAMGKTLASWPQLGGAALLNGSAVAYCVRKIVNGQPLEKNRAIISLDERLDPTYFNKLETNKRKKRAAEFKKTFNL